ncbi:hypothetical protein B484DRAFT_456107 [Ochromonadaceae sp. CCMP2298]|nr:hypothetical protein B484DRAFT_456107 [Ochromonadaceae sp. CCMP2298]
MLSSIPVLFCSVPPSSHTLTPPQPLYPCLDGSATHPDHEQQEDDLGQAPEKGDRHAVGHC